MNVKEIFGVVDGFSNVDDLIKVRDYIKERINWLASSEIHVGQKVYFVLKNREKLSGVVQRVNVKTASVVVNRKKYGYDKPIEEIWRVALIHLKKEN